MVADADFGADLSRYPPRPFLKEQSIWAILPVSLWTTCAKSKAGATADNPIEALLAHVSHRGNAHRNKSSVGSANWAGLRILSFREYFHSFTGGHWSQTARFARVSQLEIGCQTVLRP